MKNKIVIIGLIALFIGLAYIPLGTASIRTSNIEDAILPHSEDRIIGTIFGDVLLESCSWKHKFTIDIQAERDVYFGLEMTGVVQSDRLDIVKWIGFTGYPVATFDKGVRVYIKTNFLINGQELDEFGEGKVALIYATGIQIHIEELE